MLIRAYGRSMWPLLPPGSTLEIEPLGHGTPQPGEIVVAVRAGRTVAHRVARVDSDGTVVTRGDALRADDPPWRSEELVGTVRAATIRGVRVALDGAAARAIGRIVARRPPWFEAALAVARPAARAVRAAALAAVLASTRVGLAPMRFGTPALDDERDLDRLLLLLGIDAGAGGSTALRDALASGAVIGAHLRGRLVAAILPPAIVPGAPGDAGRPLLAVHPLARGSVERALLDAAAARGLGRPRPLAAPPPWLRAFYRAACPELIDTT